VRVMGGNGGAGRLGVVATHKHPRIAPSPLKKFRLRFDDIIYSLGFFFYFLKKHQLPASPMKF